jgi:hypothetical protein
MDAHRKYLAEQILAGDEVVSLLAGTHEIKSTEVAEQVTYRSLSRTLKIHVNLAKQYGKVVHLLLARADGVSGCCSTFTSGKMEPGLAQFMLPTSCMASERQNRSLRASRTETWR